MSGLIFVFTCIADSQHFPAWDFYSSTRCLLLFCMAPGVAVKSCIASYPAWRTYALVKHPVKNR